MKASTFNFFSRLPFLMSIFLYGCQSHHSTVEYEMCGQLYGGKMNVVCATTVCGDEVLDAKVKPELNKFIVAGNDNTISSELARHDNFLTFLDGNNFCSHPKYNNIVDLYRICLIYSKREVELNKVLENRMISLGFNEMLKANRLTDAKQRERSRETICSVEKAFEEHIIAFNDCYNKFLDEVEGVGQKGGSEISESKLMLIKGNAEFFRILQNQGYGVMRSQLQMMKALILFIDSRSDPILYQNGQICFSTTEDSEKAFGIATQIENMGTFMEMIEELQKEGEKFHFSQIKTFSNPDRVKPVATQEQLSMAFNNYYRTGDVEEFSEEIRRVLDDRVFQRFPVNSSDYELVYFLSNFSDEVQKIKDDIDDQLSSYGWLDFYKTENLIDANFRKNGVEAIDCITERLDGYISEIDLLRDQSLADLKRLSEDEFSETDEQEISLLNHKLEVSYMLNRRELELIKEKAALFKELLFAMDTCVEPYVYKDGYIVFESDDDLEEYLRITDEIDGCDCSISALGNLHEKRFETDYLYEVI